MKKAIILLLMCIFTFAMVGCGNDTTTITVNTTTNENLSGSTFGLSSLIQIGDGLYYDSSTRIIYWWNGYLGTNSSNVTRYDTTPSPYYAPNGLPYRYNPETNTFEEINNQK